MYIYIYRYVYIYIYTCIHIYIYIYIYIFIILIILFCWLRGAGDLLICSTDRTPTVHMITLMYVTTTLAHPVSGRRALLRLS